MDKQYQYQNCSIKTYNNIITGAGGVNRTIYEIKHDLSNEILHSYSLAEAYRIARLMNLDYQSQYFFLNNEGSDL